MRSKNKPSQTSQEKRHIEKLANQPCIICGSSPVEIHEPEQGFWFASMPLCFECHRGKDGWHGTRLRWSLNKMTELKAINESLRSVLL